MFEAQSRGQPKLVYARASSNDEVSRDQEGDMTSYVRNLVAKMAKEEMNNQQPLKQKQISEIGVHGGSLQANQHGNNKNQSISLAQETREKLTGLDSKHPQPSYVLNGKSTSRAFETVQLGADQRDAFEKSANGTKLNKTFSLSSAAIDGSLKSAGSHSTANRVEKVSLISTSDGKAKTPGSSSVSAPPEKVLPVDTSAERLYGSSTLSTITAERMVMILSHSKSAHTATPSIKSTERVTPISQTPTAVVGKIETASSVSKTIAVECVMPILSASAAASGGRHGNVSPLLKATSTDRISPVSSTSINIAKEKIDTATPLSKAATVGMTTPILSNHTASTREKQEITTTLMKDAVFEKSAPVLSVFSGSTSGKHETTSSLSKAEFADTLGKLTAAYYESASDVSNTSFDRTGSSSLKQSPLTPKQIYSSSPTPTSKGNAQYKSSVFQTEHTTMPLSQRHVIEPQSQETNDTKLHATTIQIHSNPQKHQEISIGQSTTSDLSLNSCSPAPNRIQSLAMSSSHIDYNQDSEPTRKPSDSFSPIASSSPPKSILKNTTSFDKGDTLLISGHHNEESADYCDFGPQKTAKIESFSVKKQVHSFFKTKISSPPPQLKRHVSMDTDAPVPEPGKEGKVLKKSVTFNSKVRLHLENDESEIDTLSVDK